MWSGAEDLNEKGNPTVDDVRERFEALRAHARTRELLAAPLPASAPPSDCIGADPATGRTPSPLVGLLVLLAVIALLLFATGAFALLCPPLMALPLAGLLVLFLVFLRSQGSGGPRHASLERFPAMVVETSVRLRAESDGNTSRSASVELLFADGVRRSFQADAALADGLAPNGMGVATLRGTRLVGFEPVAV